MNVKELDLFIPEPTQSDLDAVKGSIDKKGIAYITAPRWNGTQWTCLANVNGTLCLVEVKVTARLTK